MHSALDQTLPETPTAMTNRGARSSLPASAGSGVGGNRELHQDKREKKRGKSRKREKDTHTHTEQEWTGRSKLMRLVNVLRRGGGEKREEGAEQREGGEWERRRVKQTRGAEGRLTQESRPLPNRVGRRSRETALWRSRPALPHF